MTNTDMLSTLTRRNVNRVSALMASGMPYANALHKVRTEGVGGAEVMDRVEAYFAEMFDGVDSISHPL